jgi:predicted N-acetyltransferase YhbS/catechol 2,3-dioxygenase-like lactoylglutathione lyase family enzyme
LREEIKEIWQIDRSELIEAVYQFVDGKLVRRSERHQARGWPPGMPERETPILEDCFDRGGWFRGAFDDGRLIGVAVLESRFIGTGSDRLQLRFLHVGNGYRDRGVGARLFEDAAAEAHRRGASRLYISATPSEHTIKFYLGLGCTLAAEPEPELFELEPEDIHLEYDLQTERLRGARVTPRFISATPVLASLDIGRSVRFFCEKLGFEEVYAAPGEYGIVRKGPVGIHFWACSDADIPKATSCRIQVLGIEELFRKCEALGIVHPNAALDTKPWGSKEFAILDVDGNLVTFHENQGV